jgi:predicted ArsR family transcriptional regulator
MMKSSQALQHDTRRRIVRKLMKDKAFLREIAKELDIPTSTAAYHLKRLTQTGVLQENRGVYHVWYRLTDKGRRLAEDVAEAS